MLPLSVIALDAGMYPTELGKILSLILCMLGSAPVFCISRQICGKIPAKCPARGGGGGGGGGGEVDNNK